MCGLLQDSFLKKQCVSLCDRLKVCCAVLAQGAYDVVGQGFTFVDPAADLADVAFLALGLGLGLHMILVVGVRGNIRGRQAPAAR